MATAIEFSNVSKHFPNASAPALESVSLRVEEGELVTILGTSGSGKTTLLKLINRIYDFDSGDIRLFGERILDVEAVELRRRIGYVIQQIGLFPHMTVAQNIATVPKILGWEPAMIDRRVDELLFLVNLDPQEYKRRFPAQLSGGQQQRVGLARALAADPKIMLLDEPFGAIDAINRETLQDELIKIHRQSRKTFLFVTHDVHEAFKLGTSVLIMDHGRIQQYGPPDEIISRPANEFVSALLDSTRKQYEAYDRWRQP